MAGPEHDTVSVSLVLGSGGARGLAHIGVLHWLEEHDVYVKSISGCSIGALVGGVYAAGKLDEFECWARAISRLDIVALLDFSWQSNGLVKGDRLINKLADIVGDVVIEDLPIGYTAVATDIKNEKEVWMASGSLFDAIRASISLPFIFTPFPYNGVELIDGGVLNPVPIAPTFSDDTDITIAVSLAGKAKNKKVMSVSNKKQDGTLIEKQDGALEQFSSRITKFIDDIGASRTANKSEQMGVFDIANRAFDTMQSSIARQKLAAYPADYYIEIAKNACTILEFDRADEMIELGYNCAEEALSGELPGL